MTAHKKDLVLCNNCHSLLYWPSILHTFPVTPELGIKDPSTVSLAAFTSERGPIMEQLGEEWLSAGSSQMFVVEGEVGCMEKGLSSIVAEGGVDGKKNLDL